MHGMVGALIRAGFAVDGSLPIRTEPRQLGRAPTASAALSSSVWLVCRKRPASAQPGWAGPVLEQMRANIPVQMRRFWDARHSWSRLPAGRHRSGARAFSRHPVVFREFRHDGKREAMPVDSAARGQHVRNHSLCKPWNKLVRLREDVKRAVVAGVRRRSVRCGQSHRESDPNATARPRPHPSPPGPGHRRRELPSGCVARSQGDPSDGVMALDGGRGRRQAATSMQISGASWMVLPMLVGGRIPKRDGRQGAEIACLGRLLRQAGFGEWHPRHRRRTGPTRMLRHPWSVIAFRLPLPYGLRALHPDPARIPNATPRRATAGRWNQCWRPRPRKAWAR